MQSHCADDDYIVLSHSRGFVMLLRSEDGAVSFAGNDLKGIQVMKCPHMLGSAKEGD